MGLFFRTGRPWARLAAEAATGGTAHGDTGEAGAPPRPRPEHLDDAAEREPTRYVPPPRGPARPSGTSDADLQLLAALHASGTLSDEEFTTARNRLLGL